MKKFVVYLKDYEDHKDIIGVLAEKAEANYLCQVLNDKCADAIGMDYDEIMDFAAANKLSMQKWMIRNVSGMGSYFKFEEVEYRHTIDYSIFNYDWDETNYDWCTSDYTIPRWEEDDPEDHYYDHDLGCYYNLDLSGINQDHLEKFVKGNNSYKWYDRKQAHPDIAHRLSYQIDIHDFCNNKGFRNADNKIERMIESHVKNGGCMANVLVYKIKNCADYKHNHTFRQAAKRYIDALEQPQNFSWITNWEWCMSQYVYQDGCVMNKHDARKYWGYEEICDICGKDHGEKK